MVSIRYHRTMSMTLRLSEDEDRALTELARVEGISKQQAAVRAITEKAARIVRDEEVRRYARDVVAEYGPLLDRLAQ